MFLFKRFVENRLEFVFLHSYKRIRIDGGTIIWPFNYFLGSVRLSCVQTCLRKVANLKLAHVNARCSYKFGIFCQINLEPFGGIIILPFRKIKKI